MTYVEMLKDPRWQKMRLKVMEYARFRCQMCGAKDITLHVHHSYYLKGKAPWQYYVGSLICICVGCHEKIHPPKSNPVLAVKQEEEPPLSKEDLKAGFEKFRKHLRETEGK